MNKIENSNHEKLGIFSVVWIVISSGSVFLNQYDYVKYTLIINLIIVFAQFSVVTNKIIIFNKEKIVLFIIMNLIFILTIISASDYASVLTYARFCLVILLSLGTTIILKNDLIVDTFVKVVVVLAGISILFFYSGFVYKFSSYFPVMEFHGYNYVNALIYIFIDGVNTRNFSIFIEPGLYQVFLNIAIFAILYCEKKYRFSYMYIVILLSAIYSTQSTTGYILCLIIISGLIFNLKLTKKDFYILPIRVLLVITLISLIFMSSFFSSNIAEKFFGKNEKSFSSRKNSSIIDYYIIKNDPVFGVGVGSYQELLDAYGNRGLTIDASSNTFSQLGAIVGLPFVLLIFWRGGIYVSRLKVGFVGKWIAFTVYIISFSTQPFVLYPLFYLPVFMSYRARQSSQGDSDFIGDHCANDGFTPSGVARMRVVDHIAPKS